MFFFFLLAVVVPSYASVGCLDINGNPIDWWFMFKTPEVSSGRGYGYVYYDANGGKISSDINKTSALSQTIEQLGLYGASVDKSSVGWVLWNDQTYENLNSKVVDHMQDPNGKYYAHSKATIGFDANTGFWLAHSAPGFPYDHSICPSEWFFPKSQTYFAQHFFCFTFSSGKLNSIGAFLQQYHVYLYDVHLPSGHNWGSDFVAFSQGTFKESVDTSFTISSVGGVNFKGFGKNGATHSDLWEDYVSTGLQANILVESWCCGTFGSDCCNPSHCAGDPITDPSDPEKNSGQKTYHYDVVDIEAFKFANNDYFETKNNHAKFALGISSNWFCAGDINRVDSQRLRGGGALCTQNTAGLYSFLMNSITHVNKTC